MQQGEIYTPSQIAHWTGIPYQRVKMELNRIPSITRTSRGKYQKRSQKVSKGLKKVSNPSKPVPAKETMQKGIKKVSKRYQKGIKKVTKNPKNPLKYSPHPERPKPQCSKTSQKRLDDFDYNFDLRHIAILQKLLSDMAYHNLTPTQIAKKWGWSKQRLKPYVDKLVKAGAVYKVCRGLWERGPHYLRTADLFGDIIRTRKETSENPKKPLNITRTRKASPTDLVKLDHRVPNLDYTDLSQFSYPNPSPRLHRQYHKYTLIDQLKTPNRPPSFGNWRTIGNGTKVRKLTLKGMKYKSVLLGDIEVWQYSNSQRYVVYMPAMKLTNTKDGDKSEKYVYGILECVENMAMKTWGWVLRWDGPMYEQEAALPGHPMTHTPSGKERITVILPDGDKITTDLSPKVLRELETKGIEPIQDILIIANTVHSIKKIRMELQAQQYLNTQVAGAFQDIIDRLTPNGVPPPPATPTDNKKEPEGYR